MSLEKMNKAELGKLLEERNIPLTKGMTKKEMIASLQAKESEYSPAEPEPDVGEGEGNKEEGMGNGKNGEQEETGIPEKHSIGGKKIVSCRAEGDFVHVVDEEQTQYKLPRSEYERL